MMRCYFLFGTLLTALLLGCGKTETGKTSPTKTSDSGEKPVESRQVILFFGNSLTAAYGLEREEGFTNLLQEKIDGQDKDYRCVNAGLSGETTAGGLSRIEWILDRQKVDIFVLELGGNDGLRGLDPISSYENLKGIVTKVREKNPKCQIVLAGMQAPPNMGSDYTEAFRTMYPRLAKEMNLSLIPFLLEGVAGSNSLNQEDGIHPTAAGHVILAENIWKILQSML